MSAKKARPDPASIGDAWPPKPNPPVVIPPRLPPSNGVAYDARDFIDRCSVTAAALFYAIRAVSPQIGTTLAIAIANASLGYGRAYGVAPELIVAVALHPYEMRFAVPIERVAEDIREVAKAEAARTVNGESTRGSTIRGMAERIRSAAAGADVRRYGAE